MRVHSVRQLRIGLGQQAIPPKIWRATQAVALGLLAAGVMPAADVAPAIGMQVEPERQDDDAHWSGRLQVGAFVVRSYTRMNPDIGPETIAGPDGQADDRTSLQAGVSGELALRLGHDGPELFVRLPLEESGASAGLQFGTCLGRVEASGFYGFEEDVWRQPYQVDQPRSRTSRQAMGGDAALHGVAGTAFDLAVSLRSIKIDDDASGRIWPSLARAGLVHTWSLSYAGTAGAITWRPRFVIDRQDLEGTASSSDGARAGVAFQVPWRGLVWGLDGEVGTARYRADHPIFDERRHDVNYRATVSTTAVDVCGWPGVTLTALVGAMGTDSNLAFYDETTWLSGVLVGYGF